MQFLLQNFGKNHLNLKNIIGLEAEVARKYLCFPFPLYYLFSFLQLLLLTTVSFLQTTWPQNQLWSSSDIVSLRGHFRGMEAIALSPWVSVIRCSPKLLMLLLPRPIHPRSRRERKSSTLILRILRLCRGSRRLVC